MFSYVRRGHNDPVPVPLALVQRAFLHQILKTLHRTYANMQMKPVWSDMNPKAVTTDELFGYLHPATREWKDGAEDYVA